MTAHARREDAYVVPGGGWFGSWLYPDGTYGTAPVVAWAIESEQAEPGADFLMFGRPLFTDATGSVEEEGSVANRVIWHPDETPDVPDDVKRMLQRQAVTDG